MIKDNAFFCQARTGEVDGFTYPGLLIAGKELKSDGSSLNVLGRSVSKEVFYPDNLGYPDQAKLVEAGELVIIPNGIELIQRPSNLIDRILSAREKYGSRKILYLQGASDPYIVPALVYAGIQLFDDAFPVTEGLEGIEYTIFGKRRVTGDKSQHNVSFLEDILSNLRESIINGTLREVVEKFQVSSKAVEIIRILDSYKFEIMEAAYPVRTPYIKAIGTESLDRPDLKRYRESVKERFEKPAELKVALILPCSARKPYSTSKSHQRILAGITKWRKYVHELIVTSPVGLVPRELEESYPARFYDIPVIGLWYEDEKKMMSELVSGYFGRNKYEKIIAYLPEDLDFISSSFPIDSDVTWIRQDEDRSLEELKKALEGAVETTGKSKCADRKLETYRAIAAHQFGGWVRKHIEDVKIINSYNQDMLSRNGKILMVYNKELGKFTINKASAEFFLKEGKYLVQIDNFKPTSNVYAVGVTGCSSDVRPEDEVVLIHQGEIRGVGIAKMPGQAMVELEKGVAVKVRN